MQFLEIQLLGLIAWLCVVFSYWGKTKKQVLWIQILADILYAFHYLFLGAVVGTLTVLVCLFREVGFFFCKTKEEEKKFFWVITPLYLTVGLLFTNRIVEMLPIVSGIIYGYTLTMAVEWMVLGGLIDASYWLCYDFLCGSYVGMLTDIVMIISNFFSFLRKYRFKKE